MEGIARVLRTGFTAVAALALLLVAAPPAWAVKAVPKTVTYYQPDGTSFQVRLIGDERIVFVEDLDGNTLVQDDAGWWLYADPASHKSEKLRPSKFRGGKDKDSIPPGHMKHVRPTIDADKLVPPFKQEDDGSIGELFRKNRGKGSNLTAGGKVIGTEAVALTPTTVPVLVILVEFSDMKHTSTSGPAGEPGYQPISGQPNSSATWQTLFNDSTVPGGLNHFYKEATYNRFQWNVTVAQRGKGQSGTGTLVNDGWYSNPNTMKFWGADKTGIGGACSHDGGTAIKNLITWAVQQADADVNFAAYDTNANGQISDAELMIFVVHARQGQENYGDGCGTAPADPNNDHIWSHKWNMAANVTVDGKTIPTGHIYAIEPEFSPVFNYATTPWTLTEKYFGVGVYAHEALHTLGAPDIYDTGYDATPAGEWDLMDSGSYNGAKSGTHPAHMGGPLKQDIKLNADTDAASYGFLLENEITEITTDGAPRIDGTSNGSTASNVLHRIKAPSNTNEWFLLENRAPMGYYEPYLPEHGLLIWHRDRGAAGSGNNSYPYQANVLRKGWANTATGLQTSVLGAAFSADDNEASFTSTTDPHNKLNNGTSSGLKDIRCISAESTAMTYAYGAVAGTHVSYAGNSVSGGDGDDWIDNGESATLTVRVTNSACAGATASNVSVSLGSASASVGGASPASYATIAPGETKDFAFSVNLGCTSCQTATFDYTITVGGVTSSSGSFAKDTNRSYLWLDDGDSQAKAGWTSNPVPSFVPSACTTAARHGDWSLVPHPFAPRGNSYRAPVTGGVTFPNPDEAWVSPNITIPAGTSLQELRFSLAAEIPCVNYTRGRLWVSTNDGASWTRYDNFYKDGGDLGWEEIRANLSQFAGATQIKFLFAIYTYTCQTGCTATRGMYIDNIGVVVAQTSGGPADTIAPTTAITAPSNGATVSGTTSVTASANDNVGVTRVEFYLDGALASTDSSAPYAWSWNTATASNGSHTLTSKAFDAANNSATSSPVSVTVDNTVVDTIAPTTSITAPSNGATVSGTSSVTASASDNVGVTSVEFYLDGVLASTDSSAPYAWSWNTTTASNGSHTLTSKAFDAAGNNTTSSPVSVTVNNTTADTTPPVITNVSSRKVNNRGDFEISWTTNEASTSDVTVNGTLYANATLVTTHVRTFSGRKGSSYTYTVRSTDAAGNSSTAGPFTHQN